MPAVDRSLIARTRAVRASVLRSAAPGVGIVAVDNGRLAGLLRTVVVLRSSCADEASGPHSSKGGEMAGDQHHDVNRTSHDLGTD